MVGWKAGDNIAHSANAVGFSIDTPPTIVSGADFRHHSLVHMYFPDAGAAGIN